MSRVLPILFNAEMVRAILDGRKTVTRRVIKAQPQMRLCYAFAGYGHGKWHYPDKNVWEYWGEEFKIPDNIENDELKRAWTPPCHTDDILYVRETWCSGYDGEAYFYLADKNTEREQNQLIDYNDRKWRPSIHMPKEAARIWLKVTDVRVERLQEIKLLEILREGVNVLQKAKEYGYEMSEDDIGKIEYKRLWDSTIKKSDLDRYGWDANPWVWVIEFERCEKPEREE